MTTAIDEMYMERALELAANARGRTSPNPMVGAVIVREGRIVGEGWHRRAGEDHAEINALRMAGALAAGATMYVTLEPCAHQGRTPPCTQAIIEAHIRRVVVAMTDPNPQVNGKGITALREAGMAVKLGVCAGVAHQLNESFVKWVTEHRPFVTLKLAMSLDGKTATHTGESKWITGAPARLAGHRLRDLTDAIAVGVGTVVADNPALTARLPEGNGHNPIRVILDSFARIPLTAHVLTDQAAPTIVAVSRQAPRERLAALRELGVDLLTCGASSHVDIDSLLAQLAERDITSLLVEGGGNVNGSFLQHGAVDKVVAYIAPKLIGGREAMTAVEGSGFARIADVVRLTAPTLQLVGDNLCYTAYVKR